MPGVVVVVVEVVVVEVVVVEVVVVCNGHVLAVNGE
jgi:hypothetical protein